MFGSDHPDVAASYNNIAIIYKNQGKYEESLELYTKSPDINTRIHGGHNHPDVASSFNNIGIVYEEKVDLEKALVQHQKALEIRTRVFGSDPPRCGLTLVVVNITDAEVGIGHVRVVADQPDSNV